MDFKQYVYMTYYCSQGENDVKLIINNDDKKGEVSTLIENPTDCKYEVGLKEWHCLIKTAGCTEGEELGTTLTLTKGDFSWRV